MVVIDVSQFLEFCKGKEGSIYIARKGTVTVVEIGGVTYLINNLTPCGIIVNPLNEYWARSIDWAGGFSDYFAMGMYPEKNQRIKAEPIIRITQAQKEKLKAIADCHLQKAFGK